MLQDLVCLLFDCILENEVLDGFFIINEFNFLDEKKKFIENIQKYVLLKVEKIFVGKVKFLKLNVIYEIILKVKGDIKIVLVLYCEMEIVF